MICFHVSTILILGIIHIHFSRGTYDDCQETVYNVEVVESCPTSKIEWDIAARRKNCIKLAAEAERKECRNNEKQPEYHCLINAFRNQLLEVCVAGKIIFGYCAEFNEAGKVIQNHYSAPCEKVSPKCDKSYRSSDAYKYPGCYKLVKKTQVSTDLESRSDIMDIIIICLEVTVVICCLVVVTVQLRTRRRNQEMDIEKDTPESCHLVETAPGKTINRGADLKPSIQYFAYKIGKFQQFDYFYQQLKKCAQPIMKKENKSNELANILRKDEKVIIGVIGKITDEDLLLFPKGKAIKYDGNKGPSEVIPVLCFQNNLPLQSALEVCKKESACQLILVEPDLDVADKSIKIVDRNKEKILEAITSCLEQPLCKMLHELRLYSEDSIILVEVEALLKTSLNHDNATDRPEAPDNIKSYLLTRPEIERWSMPTCSLLEVSVNKSTDVKELQNNLKKLNPTFFTKCRLKIEKQIVMKKNTGSLVKQNDDDRNIASLTLQNKIKLLPRKVLMFPVNGIHLLWDKLKEQRVGNQKGDKEKFH